MLCYALSLLLSSTLALALPAPSVGALYTLSNDPSGNAVIINTIGSDGSLTYVKAVTTGGVGAHGVHPPRPLGPDALFSASPIKIFGHRMYVVNPGSNTVSTLTINPEDPTDIKLVGEPVDTGGEFPVSIDVNPNTGDVCVLNSGAENGVLCYRAHGDRLVPFTKFYSFELYETTPPSGAPGTPTQVLFSKDGTKLHASVKGIPGTLDGFIATWDVAKDGTLSPEFTTVSPPTGEGLVLFAMVEVPEIPTAFMAADPSVGLTVVNFTTPTTADFNALTIVGQQAACWVQYSAKTNSYWLSDLGGKLYEVALNTNSLESNMLNTFVMPIGYNATDVAIATIQDHDYLYVLAPVMSSFMVFELYRGNPKLTQNYDFGAQVKGVELTGINLAGAAIYLN